MSNTSSPIDYLVELLVENVEPQMLIDFKISDEFKERYLELSEKKINNTITLRESQELNDFLFYERVISTAKIKVAFD